MFKLLDQIKLLYYAISSVCGLALTPTALISLNYIGGLAW